MADENEKVEGASAKPLIDMKILVVFGVVIVLAVFLTTFAVNKFLAPTAPQTASQNNSEASSSTGAIISAGTEIITNLADKDESRYIKFNLAFEVTDTKLAADKEKVKELEAPIRHVVLSILVKKTSQDVKGSEGFNKLTKEIQDELNKKVFKGKLKQVYIQDFAVQ